MSLSLALACLWLFVANVAAMIPSKDNHWARAYVLMALGLPLLGWVFYQNGIWWGLAVLAAAMSVLRWPVIYLGKWIKARLL